VFQFSFLRDKREFSKVRLEFFITNYSFWHRVMKIWLVRKLSCIVLTSRSKGMIYLLAIYQKKGQKALKANFEVLINYHEADNLGW